MIIGPANPLADLIQFKAFGTTFVGLLTDTTKLQLPINCVLDGQQREVSKLMGVDGAIRGPLKGIFGE